MYAKWGITIIRIFIWAIFYRYANVINTTNQNVCYYVTSIFMLFTPLSLVKMIGPNCCERLSSEDKSPLGTNATVTHYLQKIWLKWPLSKRPPKNQDQLPLNEDQKYCRMLQREHSAIILTFIKLPFVIKIFVLSNFEWPLKTGFTALVSSADNFCNQFEPRSGQTKIV